MSCYRIGSLCRFAPIPLETFGSVNTSACRLFSSLGRKISATSSDTMEKAFLFCREFRCWCNATTTLYCYMTPCQPLTARTDDLYPIVYSLNFKTPPGTVQKSTQDRTIRAFIPAILLNLSLRHCDTVTQLFCSVKSLDLHHVTDDSNTN